MLNYKDYDCIISIGNRCCTTLCLRKLNIYTNSYPFDYIPTTPELILKYLKNSDDFYPDINNVCNKDKLWFGHFDTTTENYSKTIETFKRRFCRLFSALKEQKKILFIYTSEADVFNENNNKYNDNYTGLIKLRDYIIDTYKYTDFMILAFHTNKTFDNTQCIVNYRVDIDQKYISDDCSTHNNVTCSLYRETIYKMMKCIFNI
jgi:hypothetical protein